MSGFSFLVPVSKELSRDEARKAATTRATAVRGTVAEILGLSPSMLGALPRRGAYAIRPTQDIQPGQIAVFRNADGTRVIHRIEAVKPGHVYPKGTFNSRGDGWTPLTDVEGVVDNVYSW